MSFPMDVQTRLHESYFKGATHPALIDATIPDFLDGIAARFPNREALVSRHQGIRWTYGEYLCEIERLARGLLALGIRRGDRVGIWGPNSHEWAMVQYATARIGAIMVCINPAYRLFELEYALNHVQCKAIVVAERFKTSAYLDMLNELAPEIADCNPGELQSARLPHMTTVIRMGSE